jgi:CrcB protein
MRLFLLVFLGGGAGSYARFLLTTWMMAQWGSAFPYGTLLVNLIGCFIIGLIAGLPSAAASLPLSLRLAIMTGFLGGLTTFSTYEYESFMLLLKGDMLRATLNLTLSVFLGLGILFLGYCLSRFTALAFFGIRSL